MMSAVRSTSARRSESSIVAAISSTPRVPAIERVSAMFSAPRSDAQTTPTRVPSGSAEISWTSST